MKVTKTASALALGLAVISTQSVEASGRWSAPAHTTTTTQSSVESNLSHSSRLSQSKLDRETKQAQYKEAKQRWLSSNTSNRHVSTASEQDKARRQRLLDLTRNTNRGSTRVKSAKLNFKKRTNQTTTEQQEASRNKQRAGIQARNKGLRNSSFRERRSSFDFRPQTGQIWRR